MSTPARPTTPATPTSPLSISQEVNDLLSEVGMMGDFLGGARDAINQNNNTDVADDIENKFNAPEEAKTATSTPRGDNADPEVPGQNNVLSPDNFATVLSKLEEVALTEAKANSGNEIVNALPDGSGTEPLAKTAVPAMQGTPEAPNAQPEAVVAASPVDLSAPNGVITTPESAETLSETPSVQPNQVTKGTSELEAAAAASSADSPTTTPESVIPPVSPASLTNPSEFNLDEAPASNSLEAKETNPPIVSDATRKLLEIAKGQEKTVENFTVGDPKKVAEVFNKLSEAIKKDGSSIDEKKDGFKKVMESEDVKDVEDSALDILTNAIAALFDDKKQSGSDKQNALSQLIEKFKFLGDLETQTKDQRIESVFAAQSALDKDKDGKITDPIKGIIDESIRKSWNEIGGEEAQKDQAQNPDAAPADESKKEEEKKKISSDDLEDVDWKQVLLLAGKVAVAIALAASIPGLGAMLAIGFLAVTKDMGVPQKENEDEGEVSKDDKKTLQDAEKYGNAYKKFLSDAGKKPPINLGNNTDPDSVNHLDQSRTTVTGKAAQNLTEEEAKKLKEQEGVLNVAKTNLSSVRNGEEVADSAPVVAGEAVVASPVTEPKAQELVSETLPAAVDNTANPTNSEVVSETSENKIPPKPVIGVDPQEPVITPIAVAPADNPTNSEGGKQKGGQEAQHAVVVDNTGETRGPTTFEDKGGLGKDLRDIARAVADASHAPLPTNTTGENPVTKGGRT